MNIREVKTKFPNFKNILEAIEDKYKNSKLVDAVWIEGSVAQNQGDEYSDLDLWFAVNDGVDLEIFHVDLLNALTNLIDIESGIREGFNSRGNSRELLKHKYLLKKSNLSIDINIQHTKRCQEVKLVRGVDDYVVVFDKDKFIRTIPAATSIKGVTLKEIKEELKKYYIFEKNNIEKALIRGNWLEALMYYHSMLQTITKFKRTKVCIGKRDYGLKHIYRDLSKKYCCELEYFYDVNRNNIERKTNEIYNFISDPRRV